jgi:hypothetical protein
MGRKTFYTLIIQSSNHEEELFSKTYALECLEHNRRVSDDEWRLFQVWRDRKGSEIKREELMPY